MPAAFFHDKAILETLLLYTGCDIPTAGKGTKLILLSSWVYELDTKHQTFCADISNDGDLLLELQQSLFKMCSFLLYFSEEGRVTDSLHDNRTGCHGDLVSPEGACMGSWLPGIELLMVDYHCHRLAPSNCL